MQRQMAGCVPLTADNRLCLVSSRRHPGDLLLPKGGIEAGESAEDAAQREALEEAGIEGRCGQSLGIIGGVCWFILLIDRVYDRWPEMDERSRHWYELGDALELPNLRPKTRQVLEALQRDYFKLEL